MNQSIEGINNHVGVIIRSVGERTEQLCKKLIIEQGIFPENLTIVKETPFSTALRTSFELGIERDQKWTFCIDADVLLRPGAVENMILLAERQEKNVCEIEGYILDKFIGGPRNAGNHLYRTSILSKALENIPPEGLDIRPENHMLEALAAIGYPWKTVPYLLGIHDFEQYYKDILRKCFIYAHKHERLTELFLLIWREKASSDNDYAAALQVFASGVEHYGKVYIDAQQDIYQKTLEFKLKVPEKQALDLDKYSLAGIEEIIDFWVEPDLYQQLYPNKFGLIPDEQLTKKQIFTQKAADLGAIKIIPYSMGWALQAAGKRLQEWVISSKKPTYTADE